MYVRGDLYFYWGEAWVFIVVLVLLPRQQRQRLIPHLQRVLGGPEWDLSLIIRFCKRFSVAKATLEKAGQSYIPIILIIFHLRRQVVWMRSNRNRLCLCLCLISSFIHLTTLTDLSVLSLVREAPTWEMTGSEMTGSDCSRLSTRWLEVTSSLLRILKWFR